MAMNFIERAITPYNRSDNKLIQKQGYSLYAPVAAKGKAGMAAFAEEDFDVVDGIVRLKRDDLQLADILLWNINENRRQLIEKSKYLLKLTLTSSDAFPKLQDATFVIPTDTAYDTSIMPGLPGNNVFDLFDDTLRPVFNFECSRNSGLISLTYNTDMACWYAGVVEFVDNHYTTIAYILHDGVEIVHEELIERESSSGSSGGSSVDVSQINALKRNAVGTPTYDASTGILTFKTLDGTTQKTVDLPIESILQKVSLSDDQKTLIFTFRGDEPTEITLPVSNITLPVWVTDLDSPSNWQVPPTAEAVVNYIESNITLPEWVTDLSLPSNWMVPPTASAVVDYIEFKIASSGTGGSGGSCKCYDIPIQEAIWEQGYPETFITFTQMDDVLQKAVVHVAPPEGVNCGGFESFSIIFNEPFDSGTDVKIYMHKFMLSAGYATTYDVFIRAWNNGVTIGSTDYYFVPRDWFFEITAKTDTNEMWIMAYEMDDDTELN